MITMQFVVGTLAEKLGYVNESQLLPQCHVASRGLGLTKSCYYEAYVRTHVLEAAGMTSSGFLPPKSEWNSIMPTWVDDDYRHEVVQVRLPPRSLLNHKMNVILGWCRAKYLMRTPMPLAAWLAMLVCSGEHNGTVFESCSLTTPGPQQCP